MRSGDVFWNPLTGEKAMIVESGEESGGARVVADFAVEEGGFVPGGEHVHDHCSEHFEVSAGRIAFTCDGEERTLAAGESLTVEPGTWHRWWNAGESEVRIRATVEPALDIEGAMLATAYRRELRFRPPPDAIQRLLFPPLAAVGRRRGLQETIDRYLDLETHPSAEAGRGSLPEKVMRREG